MFNRSIVSVGRAADFPLGRSTPLKFGGGGILLLLSRRLVDSLRLLSSSTPPPHLYAYSFICWWLIPHYRDRSTDKRNVLGNTQCAPPRRLSRSFSWPSATGGKGVDEDTRRHQEQGRIFFASFAQPLLSIRSPFTSSLLFVPIVVIDSTKKVDITAPPLVPEHLSTELKVAFSPLRFPMHLI